MKKYHEHIVSIKLLCMVFLLINKGLSQYTQNDGEKEDDDDCECDCENILTSADTPCSEADEIGVCPEGWKALPNPRFCVKVFDERLTWDGARLKCQNIGADLPVAHTNENADVMGKYMNEHIEGFPEVWLDVNDREEEGKWVWHDGTPLGYHKIRRAFNPILPDITENNCATIDVLVTQWKVRDCEEKHQVVCSRQPSGNPPSCPEDWTKVMNGSTLIDCVNQYLYSLTFLQARERCRQHQAELLTIKTNNKLDILYEMYYLTEIYNTWFGGWYRSPDGWITLHGQPVSAFRKRQADYTKIKGCTSLWSSRNIGRMVYDFCKKRLRYLCSKEALVGPRDFKLDTHYHRVGGFYYTNQPILVSCDVYGASNDQIEYLAFKRNKRKVKINGTVSKRKELIQHDGKCRERTTFYYLTKGVSALDGVSISCFHGHSRIESRCFSRNYQLGLCGSTDFIALLDGPKGDPILELAYDGTPGMTHWGSTITANCTVYPGEVGKLTWVIYLPHAAPEVLWEHSEEIQEYKKINRTEDDGLGKTLETSVVQYVMSPAIQGISIACFGHNPALHAEDLSCPNDTIFGRFCVKTHEIYAQDRVEADIWWVWLLVSFLLLFIVVSLFFWHRQRIFKSTTSSEDSPTKDSS